VIARYNRCVSGAGISMKSKIISVVILGIALSACVHQPVRVAGAPFAWEAAQQAWLAPVSCVSASAAAQGTPTPGEKEGAPAASSVSAAPLPSGWPAEFAIPDNERNNFSGTVAPRVLKAGSVMYRVIGRGGSETGGYWADAPPPASEEQWRVTYAVFSYWNGASCLEQYVVPKGREVRVWEGPAGPQKDSARPGYYLAGGARQYWIPNARTQIVAQQIRYAKIAWKP
jgi:hypothetical protein